MLKNEAQAAKQITLILLHYMGGSKREWCFLTPLLDRSFKILTIDMPGFGTAVENKNFSMCQMADYVDNFIIENKLSHVIIIGHSMSGKVSMILANRKPNYLIGLVLLCPSPPCAQNMSKENIDMLVNWHQTFSDAASFVDNASVIRLDIFSRHVAITDAETANPEAFANWATQGSQEDWSSRLSKIMLPSMLILGELDKQVPGLEFQKENTANFLLEPDIEIFPKAGHLIPYQYPMQLSKAINKFIIKHFLHSIEG